MGKVLITYIGNRIESFKCKSFERAKEIASKRKRVLKWEFYEQGQKVPPVKKKIPISQMPHSFEELEMRIRMQTLI